MAPPKNHMRTVAPPLHMLSDHTQDFHFENFDHETDLDSISEEQQHDDTRTARTATSTSTSKRGRLPFLDNSDESDSNYTTTTTSLSDIIVDGLPTAVKVLGPLRTTIRRSASIRSWVSYFYEISTSSMGAQVSHEEPEGGHHEHHHTLVATSTTTTEVEMQEQHHRHQPMNSKRRRASNTMRSCSKGQASSTELVEYVEPERKGIDRFCGMQGGFPYLFVSFFHFYFILFFYFFILHTLKTQVCQGALFTDKISPFPIYRSTSGE